MISAKQKVSEKLMGLFKLDGITYRSDTNLVTQ